MNYVDLLSKEADGRFRVLGSSEHYEIEKDTPVLILKMAKVLHDRFGFNTKKPVSGLDETVIECTKGEMDLLLGWDGSTGISIWGKHRKGKSRIADCCASLDGIFDDPVFKGYVRLSCSIA